MRMYLSLVLLGALCLGGGREGYVVGFDLDDTLAFTTPAFAVGFESEHKPFSPAFWETVNASDHGRSTAKASVQAILNRHLTAGNTVVVVTARKPINTAPVIQWVAKTFGLPASAIYFADKGKVDVLRSLGVSVFYGDSDSDIADAQKAGAEGVRVLRSPRSSYKAKYSPGCFGEAVLPNTAD